RSFSQAEDGIRDHCVTGVQTCALPISAFDNRASLGSTNCVSSRSPRFPPMLFHRLFAALDRESQRGPSPTRLLERHNEFRPRDTSERIHSSSPVEGASCRGFEPILEVPP